MATPRKPRSKAAPASPGRRAIRPKSVAAATETDAIASKRARRARVRERSRDDILQAARRVILERGIPGTTLDAVAREVGMSKPALYYYFPSKDALLFELVHGVMASHATAVHDAVELTQSGGDALAAIVRESFHAFASHLDDFRLAFMHGQVAGKGALSLDEEQFARVRPLNELWFEGAARRLGKPGKGSGKVKRRSAPIEPRLMAFLAYCSAVGVLTMKGMVENLDDPLRYSDEQLVEGLVRVFGAASGS